MNTASVRQRRVQHRLGDGYGAASHVTEFENELVKLFRGVEDNVGLYRFVFSMPYVDGYSHAVAGDIFDPGIPHQWIYFVEVNEVTDNIVHDTIQAIGRNLDLVVLDDLLDKLPNVGSSVLVAT